MAGTKLAAKFVPKLLNFEQLDTRTQISKMNLQAVEDDPELLSRVITGDESWVYGYDIETKAQSAQWCFQGEPRPKKIRQSRSQIKVLLTVFFDYRGVVHHEYLPYGSTVTKEYYTGVLKRLRDAVRRKRRELWKDKSWVLHHDNAPAHTSLMVSKFLKKHSIPVLPQPPYSPDLAPCDFYLFKKLKTPMKGKRFDTREDIMKTATEALYLIPKNEFQKCFEDLKHRWAKCVASKGSYFEGDKELLEN